MPRYLYECKSCDQRTLIIREIQHPEQRPHCIECGQEMARRYDFGLVKFVGKGFASNDIQ
jgi:putative FmdB family regulatory protein